MGLSYVAKIPHKFFYLFLTLNYIRNNSWFTITLRYIKDHSHVICPKCGATEYINHTHTIFECLQFFKFGIIVYIFFSQRVFPESHVYINIDYYFLERKETMKTQNKTFIHTHGFGSFGKLEMKINLEGLTEIYWRLLDMLRENVESGMRRIPRKIDLTINKILDQ